MNASENNPTGTGPSANSSPNKASAGSMLSTMTIGGLLVLLVVGVVLAIRGALGPSGATGAATTDPTAPPAKLDTLDAVLNAAKTYTQQDELGKAEAVLRQGIIQWPEEPRLYVSLGELLVSRKNPADAYVQYEQALSLGKRDPEVEFAAGTVANMAGLPERALEHYAAVQAANPTDKRVALYMSQVQLKLNQVTEAKANLLIAGNLDPDNPMVWGTLAEVALRENKLELALSHVGKARQAEPDNLMWRLVEGRAKARQGKPEDSLQLFVGLSDLDKRDPAVLAIMSECYGMLKRPGDAATLYAKAADAEPTSGELAMQAALWHQRAGDAEKAIVYARRAKMLDVRGADAVVDMLEKNGAPGEKKK